MINKCIYHSSILTALKTLHVQMYMYTTVEIHHSNNSIQPSCTYVRTYMHTTVELRH